MSSTTAGIWYGSTGAVVLIASLIYAVPVVRRAWAMREYCQNTMHLSDEEVSTMPWDVFVQMIAERDKRILGYNGTKWQHLVMIITRKSNYLVALYNQRLMNVSVPWFPRWRNVTTVFEWCFDWATADLWTDLGEVNPDYLLGDEARAIAKLRRSFARVGLLGLLASPLVLVAMTGYAFFAFLEQVRNSPGVLFSRTWSTLSRWQMRCFDEVDCCLADRLASAYPPARNYTNQFKNPVSITIARFLVFALAVLIAPLVVVSLIAEDVLELNLWGDPWPRKVIWVFTIVAALLAVVRAVIPGDDFVPSPHRYMEKTLRHVRLPDIPPQRVDGVEYHYEWVRDAHAPYVFKRFNGYFKAKYLTFLSELSAVITVPFIFMYSMYDEAGEIIQFLRKHTVELAPGLGTKFTYSGLESLSQLPAPSRRVVYEAPIISGGRTQYQGMATIFGMPSDHQNAPLADQNTQLAQQLAQQTSQQAPASSSSRRSTLGDSSNVLLAGSAPPATDYGSRAQPASPTSVYGRFLPTSAGVGAPTVAEKRDLAFRNKIMESVITFGGFYPHWQPASAASTDLLKSGDVQQYGSTAYRPNPAAIANEQMVSYLGVPHSRPTTLVRSTTSDDDDSDRDDSNLVELDDVIRRHTNPPQRDHTPQGDENV